MLKAATPRPGVLLLRLARPEKRNALNPALVEALIEALRDPDARAVVLSSADPAGFCAGADLSLPDAARAAVSERLYALYAAMVSHRAPIIAAVGGPAVGGGAQLAVAADIRIGSPAARIRFVGPAHGLAVGTWALPSLVGRGRALELCLSMRDVGADEALAIGLLDRRADDAEAAALDLATHIATLDPPAVARLKGAVRDSAGLLGALEAERAGNAGWSGAMARPATSRTD